MPSPTAIVENHKIHTYSDFTVTFLPNHFRSISRAQQTTTLPWLLALCLLLGCSLCQAAHSGEDDSRFQIDLMVFANNNADESSELWRDRVYLHYPKNWASLHWGDEGQSFERIAEPDPEFGKAAAAIKRSSAYRVLYSASWQQDLGKLSQAPAVLIKGGHEMGKHSELEGYIKVAVERYLYLETDLWLSKFADSVEQVTSNSLYLPQQPHPHQRKPSLVDEEYESSPEYRAFLLQNPHLERRRWDNTRAQQQDASDQAPHPIERIAVLQHKRRMRSDELHFIDHPLFGVIAKITKLKPLEAILPDSPDAPSASSDTTGQQ